MSNSKKKEVFFDDLQRYISEGGMHLLEVIVSDHRLNILIALHRNQELTAVLHIPPFYAKLRSPLYLIAIEITGFREVINQVPIELSYPAIADITLNTDSLIINTCDGDGYLKICLEDSAKVNINFYDREIGFQVEERILFVHTEDLIVNEPVLRELIS